MLFFKYYYKITKRYYIKFVKQLKLNILCGMIYLYRKFPGRVLSVKLQKITIVILLSSYTLSGYKTLPYRGEEEYL